VSCAAQLLGPVSIVRWHAGPEEGQFVDSVRVTNGEELGHVCTLGHAEDMGTVPPNCIHNRVDVLNPHVECWHRFETIRQSDAALVEMDDTKERAEMIEYPAVELVIPLHVDVGDDRWDVDCSIAGTELLVGDSNPVCVRVMDLGHVHGLQRSGNRCWYPPVWCRSVTSTPSPRHGRGLGLLCDPAA